MLPHKALMGWLVSDDVTVYRSAKEAESATEDHDKNLTALPHRW